ncbi:hypothetical protein A2U01_0071823, partial [Trifolium medium]|nr:hypothetical protein [Trifolium medium]
KELDEKKLQFEKMIEALKHEDAAEEAEPIVGDVDARNDAAGDNVGDDAEDEEDDSGSLRVFLCNFSFFWIYFPFVGYALDI